MSVKTLITSAHKLFSFSILKKISNQKLVLPYYHIVTDKSPDHIANLYKPRNVQTFISDLEFLCENYKAIGLAELRNYIRNPNSLQQPSFHLTFDDGLSEMYSIVAPILEKKGIPATFFINTAFVDNRNLFYRYKVSLIISRLKSDKTKIGVIQKILGTGENQFKEIKNELLKIDYSGIPMIDEIAKEIDLNFNDYLIKNEPYLNSKQIKDLINRGFSFGSHSIDHPFFRDLTFNEQKLQLSESLRFLKEKFQIDSRIFSFPFSDFGVKKEVFEWMYNEGICELSFGTSGIKQDVFNNHLHRIPTEKNDNSMEDIIKAEYFYYLLKGPLGKNKIRRN